VCACSAGGEQMPPPTLNTHTNIHTHTHAHTLARTHARTFTHAHTRTHARTHTHTHAHTRTHTRTRTHTHTHTHTILSRVKTQEVSKRHRQMLNTLEDHDPSATDPAGELACMLAAGSVLSRVCLQWLVAACVLAVGADHLQACDW